jgi:hypothetical protein
MPQDPVIGFHALILQQSKHQDTGAPFTINADGDIQREEKAITIVYAVVEYNVAVCGRMKKEKGNIFVKGGGGSYIQFSRLLVKIPSFLLPHHYPLPPKKHGLLFATLLHI